MIFCGFCSPINPGFRPTLLLCMVAFFSWLDFVPAQVNGQKNTMAARNRGLWVGCTAVLYEYNLRYTLNCCCWYSSTRYHDSLSKHINKCLCIYRPHPISNIRPALNGLQKWPKSPKSKIKIGEITAKIILFDFLFTSLQTGD